MLFYSLFPILDWGWRDFCGQRIMGSDNVAQAWKVNCIFFSKIVIILSADVLCFHCRFYMTAMLPELASPRFTTYDRKTDIRDFLYLEALEKDLPLTPKKKKKIKPIKG